MSRHHLWFRPRPSHIIPRWGGPLCWPPLPLEVLTDREGLLPLVEGKSSSISFLRFIGWLSGRGWGTLAATLVLDLRSSIVRDYEFLWGQGSEEDVRAMELSNLDLEGLGFFGTAVFGIARLHGELRGGDFSALIPTWQTRWPKMDRPSKGWTRGSQAVRGAINWWIRWMRGEIDWDDFLADYGLEEFYLELLELRDLGYPRKEVKKLRRKYRELGVIK